MFDSFGARLRKGLFGAVAAMACGASVLTGSAAAQTIVLRCSTTR